MRPSPARFRVRFLLALGLAAALPAASARADEVAAGDSASRSAFSIAGDLDVNSRYIWRGMAFSDGLVVNPSLTIARGGLSLNVWANVDRRQRVSQALNEVDGTLAWTRSFAGLDLTPSALLYSYPGTGVASTVELAVEIGHAVAGPVSAFTSHTVDVRQARGGAFSALGLRFELPERAGVTLAGNAQYGRGSQRFAAYYSGPERTGLDVASAGLSATVALPGGVSLRAHVDAYHSWSRGLKGRASGSLPLVWGLALDRAFGAP